MPRPQLPLGLPSWLRDLPLGAFHLHRARGLFPTSGRLGFSPDWPGSPLLGSCGPGREKTPFSHELPATASIPSGCFLTFNAVILDSQRPREALGKTRTPKALPAPWAPGHGRPGGLEEITALSYRRCFPNDHQPRREPIIDTPGIPGKNLDDLFFAKVSACRIALELYIARSLRTPALRRGVYSAEVRNTKSRAESVRTLWRNELGRGWRKATPLIPGSR